MNLFIVSIALVLCSVSANPAPQLFGYQPATPVGQWVSNSLQNSLQSVANAIQSISRPSQGATSQIVTPNQVPGPETYLPGPVQTVVQPVPVQTIVQPYQPGPYPPGAYPPGTYPPGTYPPGPYQPGPYPPGPYEQIHVIPVPPLPPNGPWQNGGIPYRNTQNDETKPSHWIPLPLYYQFGEPSIIIISRPPSKPVQQNETASHENSMNHQNNHPTNSTNMQTDTGNTTTNFPQNEQTFTSTPGKND